MGRIDNDAWQHRVWQGIRDGYGVEDIALQLGCDLDHVRREVSILRASGELAKIYSLKSKGPGAGNTPAPLNRNLE